MTVGIPTYNRSALLTESIRSVLAQTHSNLVLFVSDNASTDDTEATVASFDDPRIRYSRLTTNIGMLGNFNRIVDLVDTDYLVLLPDDDLLRPEHLQRTLEVMETAPDVGVVHTAFDIIDPEGNEIERSRSLVPGSTALVVEGRDQFIERSMRTDWTVCWPSALFRTRALRSADALRPDDEPVADFTLMMRIALSWKIAHLGLPLAAVRVHAEAYSAGVGAFSGGGYTATDSYAGRMFQRRSGFLDRADLPPEQLARYREIANSTLRRDTVRRLRNRAGADLDGRSATTDLLTLARSDPRIVLLPDTWRLIVAQLGGRRIKRLVDGRRAGRSP